MAKRKWIRGALVVLAVWPAVQMYLSFTFGLSSWKLAGWGMYATPRPKAVHMEIQGTADGQRWLPLGNPSDALRRSTGAFLQRQMWLGRLAVPNEILADVQRAQPSWRKIRVTVFTPLLDRASSHIEMKRTEYELELPRSSS